MEDDEIDERSQSHEPAVPFSVLMQQACTIKSKQNEVFRRKYDTWPSWLQHTMFSSDEVIHSRSLPFPERIQKALEYKQQGNDSLQQMEYYESINHYETAMSIFHWIVNKKENWKRQEIEDDMLEIFEYQPVTQQERQKIDELKCSCLLNIALAYQKLVQWNDCIKACTAVLDINPNSTKAYYRRAQARLLPVQCGATENEMALQDLKKAYEISPNDPVISKLYFQVKKDLEEQRRKDLQTFGGLFDRGSIYKPGESFAKESGSSIHQESSHPSQESMTVGDALTRIRDMETTAKTLYRDGKIVESRELEEKARSLRKEIEEFQESSASKKRNEDWLNIDYSNPTPETIEIASKMGLDLTDPRVVAYLEDIQRDLRKKELKGHKPDAVLESIESVHQQQVRQTATFICDGWDERELNSFAKYRLQYHQSATKPSKTYSILAKWAQIQGVDSKKELLIQSMMEDLIEKEATGDDSSAVVEMLNERYGLQEIEKEQKLRMEATKSSQYWITFLLSGFIFFILLFVPAYLRSCQRLCSQEDCSQISSFCSVYFHLFSSFYSPTESPPTSLSAPSLPPMDDDLF